MEPVVATGGNRSQIGRAENRLREAKTVAVCCDQLPEAAHGEEGVYGSSPSEGLHKSPANAHIALSTMAKF